MEIPQFIWEHSGATIEFKNGTMQYFREDMKAKDYDLDVCYFYYDISIKVGEKELEFFIHDSPNIQYYKKWFETMISHDTKNNGYILDDVSNEYGFTRKVHYHQDEIFDFGEKECFIRLEKYHYEVKQHYELDLVESTNYKMTIGEFPYNSEYDQNSCIALFINYLGENDLRRLSQMAEDFIAYTIELENEHIDLERHLMRDIEDRIYEEKEMSEFDTEQPLSMEEYIESKDQALQTILHIGYDYDGYNSVENLKKLIDELMNVARIGLDKTK